MLRETEIPCLSEERLVCLGYRSRDTLILPFTRISVDLGYNFYKDDGVFESLPSMIDNAVNTYVKLGWANNVAEDRLTNIRLKASNKNTGGLCLSPKIVIRGGKVKAISKMVTKIKNETARVYTHAHEEGHVVEQLEQVDRIRVWLVRNGFCAGELSQRIEQKGEQLACIVGLAEVLSRGLSPDVLLTEQSSGRKFHEKILSYF